MGDIIQVYKILNGGDESLHALFKISSGSINRGYNSKLQKSFVENAVRKYFLSIWVINNWNSLLHDNVNAVTMNRFKAKLDKFWVKKV